MSPSKRPWPPRSGVCRRAGRAALLISFYLALWPGLTAAADAPELRTDSGKASAGYYRLTWDWQDAGNVQFQLQESRSEEFSSAETIYEGPDRATLLSGRRDGDYYYRARLQPRQGDTSPWSEVVHVRVEHHSLGRALLYFGIGAGVFVATAGLIIAGTLKSRKRENA